MMHPIRENILREQKWVEENKKWLLEEYQIYLNDTIRAKEIEYLQGFRQFAQEKYIIEE
jgi:hypothetical protein